MPVPGLTVVAEGQTARGERWYLKAGGSAQDYYTLMETIYPDGHRTKAVRAVPRFTPGVCSTSAPDELTRVPSGLLSGPAGGCGGCSSARARASSVTCCRPRMFPRWV